MNIKVYHARGYIENSLGINLCTVFKAIVPQGYKNFVKDHDFIEICPAEGEYTYYLDPSIYDMLGLDIMTTVENKKN